MLAHPEDGSIELFITQRLLRLRRQQQQFFRGASYVPLASFGDQKNDVVSFARISSSQIVVVAVGRFFARLGRSCHLPTGDDVWHDSAIVLPNDQPDLRFTDLFTGRVLHPAMYRNRSLISLSDLFERLPVAVLVTTEQ